MNAFNNPNKKNDQEDFENEDQQEEQNEAKANKMREENKNAPENFGSLRHQKGAVDDQDAGDTNENEDESEDLNKEEEDRLGEPEYRDPIPPATNARY